MMINELGYIVLNSDDRKGTPIFFHLSLEFNWQVSLDWQAELTRTTGLIRY